MLSKLLAELTSDPWRIESGFTPEIQTANERLVTAADDSQRSKALGEWLERYQPCLFGRVAAKKNLITYCFLTEEDLSQSDEFIRGKIQTARTDWTRLGYEGKRSAFVLLAISEKLISARPDAALLAFTIRLAELYLLQDVQTNAICLDEIFLELPGSKRFTWRWNVGVNFFGAGADKRWWQDHRIPGGLGFSANSVGHLVKSGTLAESMNQLEQLFGVSSDDLVATKVTSLGTALEWAMRTINNASVGPSGKATELIPTAELDQSATRPKCPIALPDFLEKFDHCEYRGAYHTDITIPSEYFEESISKPVDLPAHLLDFTYLFDQRIENPDSTTTGTGRRVRSGSPTSPLPLKLTRTAGQQDLINAHPRLLAALADGVAR